MSTGRKSVCFVMHSLKTGGAERVNVTILKHIDRKRFSIDLVIIGGDEGQLRAELPGDIKVTCLGKRRARQAMFSLLKLLRSRRPDILFVNLSHLNLLVAMFRFLLPWQMIVIARETNVVSMNNQEYRFPVLWGRLFRLFYRRLDHVICQSDHMLRDLVTNFDLPVNKASIIGNPIDIKRIRSLAKGNVRHEVAAATTNLVAVGTLHSRKNFDGMLRSLALCSNKDITLEICGDGPERQRLNDLAQELGLANRVKLRGYVRNPYPRIAAADALILTSAYEGLPNVVLEALALQTPVIATPAGGVCKELLAGRDGCVVARDNSDRAIADAISFWTAGAPYQICDGAVNAFDARVIVKRFETLFETEQK